MNEKYGKDSGTGRHPGSMVKVVSALVAYDSVGPEGWGVAVTADASDLASPQESVMGLEVGDVVTYEGLLHGLLVASGNDAARAIARYAGQIIRGSEGTTAQYRSAFVSAMNTKAADLGMVSSNFLDSWGVTAGTRMSPLDTARAMWAMAGIPELITILSAEFSSVTVGGPNPRVLNLNHGFRRDGDFKFPEVIACKNGYAWDGAENSGRCSVALWEVTPGDRRVSVVMGGATSIQRYQDLRTMMNYERGAP